MKNTNLKIIWCILMLAGIVTAQHRGDWLSFQGLDEKVAGGIESMAMGGAFTAVSGKIDNLFNNTAGLATLNKWTISINANYYKKTWWENQVYRPDRYFVTLPFYLEGMYVPDPKNNGVLDRDLALDSSYVVNPPSDEGKRVDSKEAADWVKDKSAPVFNSVALAIPFRFMNKKLVLAAAYHQKLNFLDFDRNDTYLLPHVGYNGYEGWVPRVNGVDTLNVNWFKYLRQRTGNLKSLRFALATQITGRINFGLALEYISGKSTDVMQLNKMGYFGLIDENKFFFTYDTLNYEESGKSDFSALGAEVGLQYHFEKFTVGINVSLPHTLKRKWTYNITEQTANNLTKSKISGEDHFEVPAIYNVGLSFEPAKSFLFTVKYRYAPYHNGTFKLARNDTTFRKWANQYEYMFGARYKVNDVLSFMAGYHWQTSVFVPDGVAYNNHGPEKVSITVGSKISFGKLGSLLMAGEFGTLEYHDTYFSNTNYATEKLQNFSVGYVYQF